MSLWFINANGVSKGTPNKLWPWRKSKAETTFACDTLEDASLKSSGLSPRTANFSP